MFAQNLYIDVVNWVFSHSECACVEGQKYPVDHSFKHKEDNGAKKHPMMSRCDKLRSMQLQKFAVLSAVCFIINIHSSIRLSIGHDSEIKNQSLVCWASS